MRAAGLTWPAAATKHAMNKLLLNRRDAEQEEDIILKRTDKNAYAETNEQLDTWLLAPFLDILAGIKAKKPWSPQYADSKWPLAKVLARQNKPQKQLIKQALPLMVSYLAKMGPAVASGGNGGAAAAAAAATAAAAAV